MKRTKSQFHPEPHSHAGRRFLRGLPLAFFVVLFALSPATALAAGSVVTKPATKVHHTTTVLNGHLDPEGDPGVTECAFEWGKTIAYGNTASCVEGDAFNAPADVSTTLSGLSPGETYHFRLRIETTSNGPFTGADQSFKTVPVPSEHPLVVSFGSDGTSSSTFPGPASPAIHQTSRRLYAGHRSLEGVNQLHGFDASAPPAFPKLGGFPLPTSRGVEFGIPIAVDDTGLTSAGNVYFATETGQPGEFKLNGVAPSGATLLGFPIDVDKRIWGIAVRSDGEVWVATESHPNTGKILKYSSSGALLGTFDLPPFPGFPGGTVRRIVFDSEDNLYVSLYPQSLWKLSAASDYTSATKLPEPPGSIWSLAFDSSTESLYASTFTGDVSVYDLANNKLFDEFATGGGYGIAVDAMSHAIYAGSGSKIHVYATGASLSPPTATTAPPSVIAGSKATLTGFVDPEGQPVGECRFEYGQDFGSYPQAVPCSSNPGSGSGDVAVSADVSGLVPNTTYHYRVVAANSSAEGRGEDEIFTTNPPPVIGSPAVENLTFKSADLKALVDPKGYETTYRFEYGTTTSYGTKVPIPDGNAGSGKGDVPVSAHISGLSPDTIYHWRLVAENVNGITTMPDQTFTSFGPVKAETTGSPIRTTTTAQLQARVNPDGAATTYRFEYGSEGPCDANPCTATPDRSAGSDGVYRFVAEEIEGLEPDTTYHYRVIAESPTPGGPAIGEDMIVATRASDAPLSHGDFPGPPGSDRAYEQVSAPNSGGNPVPRADAVSDDGSRAFYKVNGGTPLSDTGSTFTMLYAERIETASHQGGWRSTNVFPPRQELVGSAWLEVAGKPDLSEQVGQNFDTTSGTIAVWRLRPGHPPFKLLESSDAEFRGPLTVSEDASRVLTSLRGAHDPAHVPPNSEPNLYDIASGSPRLVGLLPDGSIPSCGAVIPVGGGGGATNVRRASHWVSPDGSLVFFRSCTGFYLRDLVSEETTLIGEENLSFVKSTPGAAFFGTSENLAPEDTGGGDLYRYDLASQTFKCVTCFASGLRADINTAAGVAVAEDGSRAYFVSSTELIRGASTPGMYRVEVDSGELAYVAPSGSVSDDPNLGNAITPNGSALVFASNDTNLSQLGGQQNGNTLQYYRYDDGDRSVTCVSCPQDGSVPSSGIHGLPLFGVSNQTDGAGANKTALSADGTIFAFSTPTALLPADQNTAGLGESSKRGTDVYEWRDGHLLLVTDGLTDWPDDGPQVSAITPSGEDIFFSAAIQYTQDALDGYSRLYTARIGGGFEFPPPPRPCPLEVCQGTPKGAPEEQAPGSGSFVGQGNKTSVPNRRPCPKGRHKTRRGGKVRCVRTQGKKSRNRRAKHDRRAQR